MLPTANEIIYFLEIAKSLNLSRAAERLGITQPTLSMALKKLEDNIGEQLFIRTKAGVQLTKFGIRFIGSAQKILEEWEKLKAVALSESKEVQGQYRVGCHPSVGLYTLFKFLPDLLSKYPKLEIQLVHDISRYITEKVISYNIDFGIVVNPVEHPDLVIIEIAKDFVTFWTTKNNKNKDVLICDQNLLQIQHLAKKIKEKNWRFERVIDCSNLEVITNLVAHGCGIGILPTRVAKQEKNLIPYAKKEAPQYEDSIALIYRYDTQNTLAATKIIEAIKCIFTASN